MTAEEYLREITPGCPVCGTSEFRQDKTERAQELCRRVTHIKRHLEELELSPVVIGALRQRLGEMCGMCQLLLTGISSPLDASELRDRIKLHLAELQAEIDELRQAA
jgi:predicted  nucleic acid-binding Zn-ribbon protein